MALPEMDKQADYTGKSPGPEQWNDFHLTAVEGLSLDNHLY
jgi:hypothetical protein